jgi:hypothetical protein
VARKQYIIILSFFCLAFAGFKYLRHSTPVDAWMLIYFGVSGALSLLALIIGFKKNEPATKSITGKGQYSFKKITFFFILALIVCILGIFPYGENIFMWGLMINECLCMERAHWTHKQGALAFGVFFASNIAF